ncbi:MAG: hypothetical protein BroJett018_16590 [Chloroflexota bacterium]|nr:MAG: hypothetical protein BroJett018_16590 [Chloroflexota bacterium]
MTKINQNGVQADFDQAERVIQRTVEVFAHPVVKTGINEQTARAMRLSKDFYPPNGPRYPFRFATAKQRRYYWWRVSQGGIAVPYRRTFRLLKATTIQPEQLSARGFVLSVSIDRRIAPYGPYVIADRQLPGHFDTGWPKLHRYVRDQVPGLAKQAGAAYGRTVRGYLIEGQVRR